MKLSRNLLILIIAVAVFLTVSGSMFIVSQTQQALVLQFGFHIVMLQNKKR